MYEYTIAQTKQGWILSVLNPLQEDPTEYLCESEFEAHAKLAQIQIDSLKEQND